MEREKDAKEILETIAREKVQKIKITSPKVKWIKNIKEIKC